MTELECSETEMISLSTIKNAYEKVPQPIKNVLLYVPFSAFLGKTYRNELNRIRRGAQLSSEEQVAQARVRLLSHMNKAISDTPYYRQFAKKKGWTSITSLEQFYEFPVVQKQQVTDDLHWFVPETPIKRYVVTTGGTTGRQAKLYMSNEAYRREWAYLASLLQGRGIDIDSRRICLRGVDFKGLEEPFRYNPLYKELQVSPFKLTEKTIDRVLEEVRRYRPTWIHGYPSSTSEFARLCRKRDVSDLSLKHVLLVSEKAYPEQEKVIVDTFGAKIVTFYGMTERVIFAARNGGTEFIPNHMYGFTEEVDGELVGTGYINAATRLIRYATGDQAIVEKEGGLVTKIERIVGRSSSEHLVSLNGARVTMTSLNIHSQELNDVRKYQFYQDTPGVCELRVVLSADTGKPEAVLKGVERVYAGKLGDEMRLNVVQVDDIPLTARGKHRFIVSDLD